MIIDKLMQTFIKMMKTQRPVLNFWASEMQ